MTDDAIAELCDVKFSQVERNGRKFRHIEVSITVASLVKFSNCLLAFSRNIYKYMYTGTWSATE